MPALGSHTLELEISDLAGNRAAASFTFERIADHQAPLVTIVSPAAVVIGDDRPQLRADYLDDGSGIERASVLVTLDGVDVTDSCIAGDSTVACQPPTLGPGPHVLGVEVEDKVGNLAQASRAFEIVFDDSPPSLAVSSPQDGALVATPTLTVTGSATDDDAVAAVLVNGVEALLAGGSFTAAVAIPEGESSIAVVAMDRAGQRSETSLTVVLDSTPPALRIDQPAAEENTNGATISVAGVASDANGVAQLTVGGIEIEPIAAGFQTIVDLVEGANAIEVIAVDPAGNSRSEEVVVHRFSVPAVTITSPRDLSLTTAETIDVSGTLSDPLASVTVNGVAAVVTGGTFVAPAVEIVAGGNLLSAVATDPAGRSGAAKVTVFRDAEPPRVRIDRPATGARVHQAVISVSGLVNDLTLGTVNGDQATVTVNGVAARVSNRGFVVEAVPLVPGDNLLRAVATDASGNTAAAEITVAFEEPLGPRIAVASGDRQAATIGETLPEPLVARLTGAGGSPVAGRAVLVRVRGSNGSLDGGRRQLVVTTGSDGRAQTSFTLGTRAGVGQQVVEASAPGFSTRAAFTADAVPAAAAGLFVDSGGQQTGAAGQQLADRLVAVVTDFGFNRLAGATVRFAVVLGEGTFEDGSRELLAVSDGNGMVSAALILDPREGVANNVVEAVLEAVADSPVASFVATGRVAGPPAETSISGLVLDNSDQPVPGVSLRVHGTALSVQANAAGLFHIPGVPVGTLLLEVDGSTAQRPGVWPHLEFVLTTIPGRDNTLGMPIYLLPLETAGVAVSETEGGTLTLPHLPGFALEVAPGSVTFPGGGRSGVVSATLVHGDKVPMVPNFGQQPRLVVTIQPAGARFDPPARLVFPNVDGLAPGEVTALYSFDHDLGRFVSIGPGTASEDGLVIASNPGVGVVKAGWHCGGNPVSSGTPHACKECWECTGNRCQPLGTGDLAGLLGAGADPLSLKAVVPCADDGEPCTADVCVDGNCIHPEAVDGTGCPDDGDQCTEDVCVGGACSHPPLECECRGCDPATGCVIDPALDDTSCTSDNDECTLDVCQGGDCKHLPRSIDSVSIQLGNPVRRNLPNAIRGDQQPATVNPAITATNCIAGDFQFEWSWGDGTTSNTAIGSHTYAQTGNYTVTATVKCGNCATSGSSGSTDVTVGFLATCYIVADEGDYGAPIETNPNGLAGNYSRPFLEAVRMQGSGRAANGDLIQLDWDRDDPRLGWAHTFFRVVQVIETTAGTPLAANDTIAVDRTVIQLGTNVDVVGLGLRSADDTGQLITGHHIDVFGGFGLAACAAWTNPVYPITGH